MLLVTSVVLLSSLMAGNGKLTGSLVATAYARKKLDDIAVSTYFNDAAGVRGIYTVDDASQTPFYYSVQCLPLPANTSSSQGYYMGGYTVTVKVWWNNDAPGRVAPGAGLRQVALTRFVYPRLTVP